MSMDVQQVKARMNSSYKLYIDGQWVERNKRKNNDELQSGKR
ncbi:hypothetical protein [Fervidibacillus halotolerans]|uniref:Uncharacterized protein n=1 Tax=Fervidibacillus halotolerans TaxID=2980027 RepID=A0A9E8M1S3_9BACI|nr:hypothetical protein [Fervidibacillus halotolerans]WAA12699.1 hypothetical protein OE105_00715 [Fervidibacillus halotolerans]